MTELEIQQGEGKWIRFTVTEDGDPVSLTSAECFFGIKKLASDVVYVYSVTNSETAKWDKTQAAAGIIRVNIPASVTKNFDVLVYVAQASFIFTADTAIDKTQWIKLNITKAVLHET